MSFFHQQSPLSLSLSLSLSVLRLLTAEGTPAGTTAAQVMVVFILLRGTGGGGSQDDIARMTPARQMRVSEGSSMLSDCIY